MKIIKYIILLIFITSCQANLTFEELGRNCDKAMKEKNWNAAISYLDEMIEREPNIAYNYFARALAKSNLKRKFDANDMLNDLNKSIALDDKNLQAWALRFEGNFLIKNFEEASKDIDQIFKSKGEIPFFLTWKANCAFANKDFKSAKKLYEKRLTYDGEYDEMRNCYYYMIFSKYYDGDENGAFMDAAFLKRRGFKDDMNLVNVLSEKKPDEKGFWEELANFYIPEITVKELDKILENKK